MTDASDMKESEDERACSWCGAHLHSFAPRKVPVCTRCYRLLSSAGLKDEEIFGGVKKSGGAGAG
jgi:protein-arginine kinase activator protein McsA